MFLLIEKFSTIKLFAIALTFILINAQNNPSNFQNSKIEKRNIKKCINGDLNSCANGKCLNNTYCSCNPGYSGNKCDILIPTNSEKNERCSIYCDRCDSVGGYCFHGSCVCWQGFQGFCCEKRKDNCFNNPCVNGWCYSEYYGYTCTCYSGYEGRKCDTKIESLWIYYLIASFVAFVFLFICCCSCGKLKRTQPAPIVQQAQLNTLSNNFQNINRFSTNPVRQISTTESIYSFETALHNSTMIVQEKNETLEFKLPTYDEYIKGNPNEAFEFSNNNEASTNL